MNGEERPRGEWLNVVKLTCQEYNGREYGECSICHKVREVENFCPHCGADMRGKSSIFEGHKSIPDEVYVLVDKVLDISKEAHNE